MTDLFPESRQDQAIGPGALLLGGFAAAAADAVLAAIAAIGAQAPFRHMITPGGHAMSVAMTNCGSKGWVSDRRGYRYAPEDPDSGRPWPGMPAGLRCLAQQAAVRAGYPGFDPDVCLINRYQPGARMALHQDRDEGNLSAPIVSLSFGLTATFLWGGGERRIRPSRHLLQHGDAVVWGGPSRLIYHGVAPLPAGDVPGLGALRYNLTFRQI
jgi:alkylated DNA repair protein (DNA oxidative demethylase)